MEIDFNALGNQLIHFGLQLLAAAAVFIVGRWLAGFLSRHLASMMEKGKVDDTLTAFAIRLSYIAMMVFVGIASLA